MTSVQKIISTAVGHAASIGECVELCNTEYNNISFSDRLCGAYGNIFLCSNSFYVPRGIFCDLTGALRNDVTTEEIAEYFVSFFEELCDKDICIEIGGDSLSYLTMDDRIAVTEKLSSLSFFGVMFECDFLSVGYVYDNFGLRQKGVFNDGPEFYDKVIPLDLSAI